MPTKKSERRQQRLMPGGIPRWIRCYDNGGGWARFCRGCMRFADSLACTTDGCGRTTIPARTEGSFDRYTVVYTGNYKGRGGRCDYVGMSCRPFHPQGFGQHGESDRVIDVPSGGFPPTPGDVGRLGRRITFAQLPLECKELVYRDYREIWGLTKNHKRKEEK